MNGLIKKLASAGLAATVALTSVPVLGLSGLFSFAPGYVEVAEAASIVKDTDGNTWEYETVNNERIAILKRIGITGESENKKLSIEDKFKANGDDYTVIGIDLETPNQFITEVEFSSDEGKKPTHLTHIDLSAADFSNSGGVTITGLTNCTGVTHLDLSGQAKVSSIDLKDNSADAKLAYLDVSGLTTLTGVTLTTDDYSNVTTLKARGATAWMTGSKNISQFKKLKTLDISQNPTLENLTFASGVEANITSLDVSADVKFRADNMSEVDSNYSKTMNLSAFTGLEELIARDIQGDDITSLYLHEDIKKEKLKNLDLNFSATEGTSSLRYLNLTGYEALTKLDISGLTSLSTLIIEDPGDGLTLASSNAGSYSKSINLTGFTALATLTISGTNLATITLGAHAGDGGVNIDLSDNTALLKLEGDGVSMNSTAPTVVNTQINTLDVSGCPKLPGLNLNGDTGLTKLDLYGCTGLTYLELPTAPNALNVNTSDPEKYNTTINLSGLEKLEEAVLGDDTATSIVADSMGALRTINATAVTAVKTIAVTNCKSLTTFTVGASLNSLKTVDISGCSSLESFFSNVTSATALEEFNAEGDEKLNAIKIPAQTSSAEKLKVLNLSGCKGLVQITGNHCQIAGDVNLASHTALETLDLSNMGLTSIPSATINPLVKLTSLDLHNNYLTTLDYSKQASLTSFNVDDNYLVAVNAPAGVAYPTDSNLTTQKTPTTAFLKASKNTTGNAKKASFAQSGSTVYVTPDANATFTLTPSYTVTGMPEALEAYFGADLEYDFSSTDVTDDTDYVSISPSGDKKSVVVTEKGTKTGEKGVAITAKTIAPSTPTGYKLIPITDTSKRPFEASSTIIVTDNKYVTYDLNKLATSTSPPTIDGQISQINSAGHVDKFLTPTMDGYTFDGWYSASAEGVKQYDETETTNTKTEYTANTTVYAHWSPNKYSVAYVTNGGKYDSSYSSGPTTSATYDGTDITLPSKTQLTKTDYTLAGWATSSTATTPDYLQGESVKNLTTEADGTVILYAIWKSDTDEQTTPAPTPSITENTYTISYDLNVNDEDFTGTAPESTTFTDADLTATVLLSSPADYEGHNFLGWALSADATTVKFKDSATVEELIAEADSSTKEVFLYALWGKTAIFKPNYTGATQADKEVWFIPGTTDKLDQCGVEFTRQGYSFDGWYTKAEPTSTDQKVTDFAGITDDVTFYASWKINTVGIDSVVMSSTAESIYAGLTVQLSAVVLPDTAADKTISWASSNPLVATVSNTGLVTGVSAGTAVITARSAADANKAATCTVTVKKPVTEVTLDAESASLYIGGTKTLTATVLPADATDKTITWKSSDTNVAAVSSTGVVTAVAPGQAEITAASKDDPSKSATCSIRVKKAATGVSLSPTKVTLNVGKTKKLQATVKPSDATVKSVAWRTSNSNVATVSSTGIVTAKAKGTAVITAISLDNTKLTASCVVTVKQPVKGVKLNKAKATVTVGSSLTLKATVTPANANNRSLTWSTSNKKAATVNSSGKVQAVGAGKAVITAKAKDGSGKTASCTITVVKRNNTIKVKSPKKLKIVYSVDSVKKGGKAYSIKASSSAGNVKYSVSKKAKKAGVSVNSKEKVIIKKGTAKGTYTITISSAGTAKYKKAADKKVKVIIK